MPATGSGCCERTMLFYLLLTSIHACHWQWLL